MDGHAALAFPALPGVKEFAALVAADASDAGGGRGERQPDGMDGSLRQAIIAPHGDQPLVDQQSNTPRLLPCSRNLAMRNAVISSDYRNNRWNSSRFR